jgi:hypothetical protein
MKVDVGKEEPHRPALGDLIGFVEVLTRAVEVAACGAEKGLGEEDAGR